MTRSWLALLISCAVPFSSLGQCTISPNRLQLDITASAIGQKGLGGAIFSMVGTCPGEPGSAQVKFKLNTTTRDSAGNSFLIVSPSSGTTPLEIQVGVNPNAVANSSPGGPRKVFLSFTTVDQTPPSTPFLVVRVTFTTPDPPVIRSVMNAASLAPVVTPGAVVLVRGHSLGPNISASLDDQTGLYPTTLGNTTVTFDGIAAPILSSSPAVIKAVAPYAIAGRPSVQVIVTHSYPDQASTAFSAPVADTSLGIFTGAQHGVIPVEIQNCDAHGCSSNSTESPAPPGSIISLFATGVAPWAGPGVDGSVAILPQLYTARLSLTIGGQPAQILYGGVAPYQVWGMFQVNARIPDGIGSGPQPVLLTVGQASNASQQATVSVQ